MGYLWPVLGAIAVIPLSVIAWRAKVRLDRRVDDFKEELATRKGPPPDPMAELADLYSQDAEQTKERR